jgi:hypothetical protein
MNNQHPDSGDELIVRAAKDYNAPGAVPREEMWNRIVEARRSQDATLSITHSVRRTRYWVWPSVGVAAAGLIAVGVAIGRRMEQSSVEGRRLAPVAVIPRDTNGSTPTAPDARRAAPGGGVEARDSGVQGGRSTALASQAAPDDVNSSAIAYRLAVLDHVAGSEAMITAFRASAHRGDVDGQLAKWSRDLLGETRLLESSASSDDVTMKRLLEDLELVLAQIVQYTNRGTHAPDDLDLIEQSLRRRAVMSNLRNISAGRLPSGT